MNEQLIALDMERSAFVMKRSKTVGPDKATFPSPLRRGHLAIRVPIALTTTDRTEL